MNTVARFIATGALALLTLATPALARDGAAAAPTRTAAIVVPEPATTVHDWDGVRYDIPPELLRSPGVLINGLPPQQLQFD